MHSFILQDWITIRGAVTTVTQSEDTWLDLTAYQDLVFWVDCREVTGMTPTPTLTFQTSPTKDDSLFTAIATTTTLSASATPQVVKATLTLALTPVARYVRWQLVAASSETWDATFRVLVAANSPGM